MWMRFFLVSLLAVFLSGCGGSSLFTGVNDGDRFQLANFTRFEATAVDPNTQVTISGHEQLGGQVQCYAQYNKAICQRGGGGWGGGGWGGGWGDQSLSQQYNPYNQQYNPYNQQYNPYNQQYNNPYNQQYNPYQNQYGQQGQGIPVTITAMGQTTGSIRVYFY